MGPVCQAMGPVCQAMGPVCQAMRQTDTGSRPAVYFYVHDDVQRSMFMTTWPKAPNTWTTATTTTFCFSRHRAGNNCPLVSKQKRATGNEQRGGNNTTVTRCCVGVGVGVGVGQAIYAEVVCWIKTYIHRLPARGTPRDRES